MLFCMTIRYDTRNIDKQLVPLLPLRFYKEKTNVS
jgi:hypothetical protein